MLSAFVVDRKKHLAQYLIFTRTDSLPLLQSDLLPSRSPTLSSQWRLIHRAALCHTFFLMRGFFAQDGNPADSFFSGGAVFAHL